MGEPAAARLLTPAFVALTLSDLAYFTSSGVLLAVTPVFAAGPLGSGEAGVGIAMGSFSLTTLLLRPLAGRWTDRRGRRSLLVGGACIFAVGVLGHFLVTNMVTLVALRVGLGAAEALYFVAGFAALADLAPAGRAGEALSLNSLALYVGVAAGPLLGQGLLARGGFDRAWAGALILSVGAAVLAARVPETHAVAAPGQTQAKLLHPEAIRPGIGLFCGVATMSGFLAFAGLQARAVSIDAWSSVLVVFGVTVVFLRLVLAKLPDRMAALRLAAAALVVAAAGLLTVGGVRTPAGLFAGAVILGAATAFLTPAVFATVFSRVPANERGSAAATTSMFIDVGLGVGPMVIGLIAATASVPTAFLLAAALPMAGAVLLTIRPQKSGPLALSGKGSS